MIKVPFSLLHAERQRRKSYKPVASFSTCIFPFIVTIMNSKDQRAYLHARAFQVRRLFDPNAARPSQEEPLCPSPRSTIDLVSIFTPGSVPRSISSTHSLRKHHLPHAFTDREEKSLAEEVLEKARKEVAASHLELRLPDTSKRLTEPSRPATQRYAQCERIRLSTSGAGRPKVQPFALRKSQTAPGLSKRFIAEFRKTKLVGKYHDFYRKYFQAQLESFVQRTDSDIKDAEMRLSLNELRKYTHQDETRMKSKTVREAVDAFKQEKLVFVYGSEFRGRYISKTHGDILKS